MNTTRPPLGEISARGKRMYHERLRDVLEPAHNGQFALINVETGEYELAESHLAASQRAHLRWPEGALLYGVRIGFPAMFHIGGRSLRKAE